MKSPQLHKTRLAVAYLRERPELQLISGRKLAELVAEPSCSYRTWDIARKKLGLPSVARSSSYKKHTSKEHRKAAYALYPNTHKIVVDTRNLKIVFHGDGGFKVTTKRSKKALSASLHLFRLAKFETRQHDIETGIMVLTLKPEAVAALESRAA